jgi:hypothetical protein
MQPNDVRMIKPFKNVKLINHTIVSRPSVKLPFFEQSLVHLLDCILFIRLGVKIQFDLGEGTFPKVLYKSVLIYHFLRLLKVSCADHSRHPLNWTVLLEALRHVACGFEVILCCGFFEFKIICNNI